MSHWLLCVNYCKATLKNRIHSCFIIVILIRYRALSHFFARPCAAFNHLWLSKGFQKHPCVTDPVGTPPHWKKWSKIRPRCAPVRKIPWNSIPIGKIHWTLIPTRKKTLKFWESPLDFWTVNNRIWNPHSLRTRDFPSPLAFDSFILSPQNFTYFFQILPNIMLLKSLSRMDFQILWKTQKVRTFIFTIQEKSI